MVNGNWFWHVLLLSVIWAGVGSLASAQTNISVEKSAYPSPATNTSPDSVGTARSKSPTVTGSTDQRFFFFNDTRNADGRRIPVPVYGLRAGLLFPSRHPRKVDSEGRSAAFKAGVGFYFVNQTLTQPGLLPGTSEAITRRLRIATAFFEPYLFRKGAIQISLPIEVGYGHSRYERKNDQSLENEIARGFFLPAGVGAQALYQFPKLRRFRPFHWFGFSVLTGYRFVLKKDIPASQINYSGLYISAGPSFFLDSFTADYKRWRRTRKKG
ncbi:hypothetical protein [Spirosoma arcticum]